jgi:hypothetical protein
MATDGAGGLYHGFELVGSQVFPRANGRVERASRWRRLIAIALAL